MADETVIPATAIEDMKIPVKGTDMLLNDVCYVPKLEVNLMSMNKLVHQSYIYKQLTYENNHAMLIMSLNCMFSFTARLNENDIYEMKRPVTYRDLIQTYDDAMASKARTPKSRGYCKNDMFNLHTYDTSCQASNEILHQSGRGWKNTFQRE
ncbi:hypothetical protein BDDG_12283 [Blastomyces dermatitidis ATCC 18188]|uniref:Retrovirus-related Pol polyprotein from transposon TNT 1-94-like beta-barrel domain-containing protein n=1 Tax=Ajellomyces dermatitidis (strain ATCC 18188 / CBS 674.68) TaxID=653446 RepID=A0A0J9HFA5_AJEDA|nr:hypothetical protein BDDG_12283 [Blastomyces dermatitidis ATCC 18188]